VRGVIAQWRKLSGGSAVKDEQRRTLAACSGGADSTALVLALRAASTNVVVGHVVHDMRSPEESLADRDMVRALAAALGLTFVEAAISAREQRGNMEAQCRMLRYRALETMAEANGCPLVATGHHGDDQLETMLMRLMRGAGVRGLAGIAGSRTLGDGEVILVRPMLGVSHGDAIRICTIAGQGWCEDVTNTGKGRMRGAIRHEIVPRLKAVCPKILDHAAASSRLLADTGDVVRGLARRIVSGADWECDEEHEHDEIILVRAELRLQPAPVLGEVLLLARASLLGSAGASRLKGEEINKAIACIRSDSTDPKKLLIAGMKVEVTAHEVRAGHASNSPG